jgi:streptogramin lyase
MTSIARRPAVFTLSTRPIRQALLATALAVGLSAFAPSAGWATTGTITEFPLPSAVSTHGVTAGPDGNMWFTEDELGATPNATAIARVTPTGVVTEFSAKPSIPGAVDPAPIAITSGPNQHIWFVDADNHFLDEMVPATGAFTTHPTVADPDLASAKAMVTGPDGNVYVLLAGAAPGIAEFKPDGTQATGSPFPVLNPGTSNPQEITVGPDGNLWFTDVNKNAISRFNLTTHVMTDFPITVTGAPATMAAPRGIAVGPDGNIWFTETGGGVAETLGHIDANGANYGQLSTLVSGGMDPEGLSVGPDKQLWFTIFQGNQIGQEIAPATAANQFPIGATAGPLHTAAGPDGNVWFSEENQSSVGRVTIDPPLPPVVVAPPIAPPAPPVIDKTPPKASRLKLTATSFRAGTKETISYTLSEASSVSLLFQRATSGRKVNHVCVKATHANRRKSSCTRYTSAGTRSIKGVGGANTLTFKGTVGSHTLAPGTYKLTLTPTDAARNVGKPIIVKFTIVAPKRHTVHHRG